MINVIVTPHDQDSEDYLSISTMLYWLRWFQLNLANMEGYLRNAGYSILMNILVARNHESGNLEIGVPLLGNRLFCA